MRRRPLLVLVVLALALTALPGLVGAEAASGSSVIRVPAPEGVPVDAANIQAALDSAPPGSTVKLARGTYEVHQPIFAADFDGTFRGAGKNRTIVKVAHGEDGEGFPAEGDHAHPSFEQAAFMRFEGADGGQVRISDMTVAVDLEDPAVPYSNDYIGSDKTPMFVMLLINSLAGGSDFDVVVKNVNFEGAKVTSELSYEGFNAMYGLIITKAPGYWATPTGDGNVQIRNCAASNLAHNAYEVINPRSGLISMLHNRAAEVGGGLWASSPDDATETTWLLIGNDFSMSRDLPPFWNIWIGDNRRRYGDGNSSMDLSIVNNKFDSLGGSLYATGIEGGRFINNIVAGKVLPIWSPASAVQLSNGDNWRIIGNRYNQIDAPGFDVGGGAVLLNAKSTDNLVIEGWFPEGTSLCDQVHDETMTESNPAGDNRIIGWERLCGD